MSLLSLGLQGRRLQQRLAQTRERLYRMAFAWCRDPMLADDLVHDCLAKALQHRQSLKDPERLDAWVFRILHNCWKDHLRGRREAEPIEERHWVDEHTPEDARGVSELVARVRGAVAALPPGQCEVLTLVDLEGFSYAQVAEMMDIPVGTVMSRLSRARQALRAPLADLGAPAGDGPPRLVRVK